MESNIPQLRFPKFIEIQPFIKFGRIVESNIYGPRFNANDYHKEGNVKTIRGTDVSNSGEFKYEQVPIAKIDKNTVKNHRLRDGDLVMITTADCGLTGVFRKQDIDYISSAYGVRIRLNAKGYPYYFKYFFQTRHAKKEVASFVRKATVANLPGSDILRIRLNLPTLPEQTKIANSLTATDKRINLLQKKKAQLEQYKKGIMQKLFSQTIRFKDKDGNAFPDWEEKKLGEICDIKKGQQLNKEELENTGTFPAINGGVSPSGYTEKWNTIENTITISEGGNSCGHVNLIKTKFWSGGHCYALLNINSEVNLDCLFQILKFSQKRIMKLRVGSGLPNIQKGGISNFKVLLPQKEEQQKIANFLSAIDKQIEKVEQQIEASQQWKKGLLQKMFV